MNKGMEHARGRVTRRAREIAATRRVILDKYRRKHGVNARVLTAQVKDMYRLLDVQVFDGELSSYLASKWTSVRVGMMAKPKDTTLAAHTLFNAKTRKGTILVSRFLFDRMDRGGTFSRGTVKGGKRSVVRGIDEALLSVLEHEVTHALHITLRFNDLAKAKTARWQHGRYFHRLMKQLWGRIDSHPEYGATVSAKRRVQKAVSRGSLIMELGSTAKRKVQHVSRDGEYVKIDGEWLPMASIAWVDGAWMRGKDRV